MTNQETLVKYLTDMYAAESHLIQPLKGQVKDDDFAAFPEARALVQRILTRAEIAQSMMDDLARSLGGDARSGFKAAVAGAAGAVAAVVNEARTHAITKKLRDDYTALSLIAVGYELLHTTGNALGAAQIADFAQSQLKEVAGLVIELSQKIIPVAVAELARTNKVDDSAIAISQANIKAAWSSRA